MDTKMDQTGLNAADENKAHDVAVPKAWKSPRVIVGTLADAQTGASAQNDGASSSANS